MAGVDLREIVGDEHQECWLRSFQVEGHLVIAVRADLLDVGKGGFTGIDPELLARPIQQEIPGTLDIRRREQPAVVPFDALPQREGQLGPLFVP